MDREGSEASVASSSPVPNWWDINANPLPSWSAAMARWQPHHPNSVNSSGNDDMISASAASFTNADSSSADLSEPTENHLWTQVLLSIGSGGVEHDLQSSHDHDGEGFLGVLSSKSLATSEMFDPTSCSDYLKKLDSSWEIPSTFNTLERHALNCYDDGASSLNEHERVTNLSNQVSNWSIAPPNPHLNDHHISPATSTPLMSHYMPYMNEIKGERQHQDFTASEPSLLRGSFNSNRIGYQVSLSNVNQWSNTSNMTDLISFNGSLHKPVIGSRPSRVSVKLSDSSESKKVHECGSTSSSTGGSGRSSGTMTEGKNKRSDDSSNAALFKKSKHDQSPVVSTMKLQAPKAKIADRITNLQQIVSPFGKTDTASVLLEAINYIRFLQEQVQLLSDPYMKSNKNKDHASWAGLERKDKSEADLRSRGLCLVPISCTPQVYRENTGPDYWTPTYRGYLYR